MHATYLPEKKGHCVNMGTLISVHQISAHKNTIYKERAAFSCMY